MKNKDAKLIAEISANHCGSIIHAKKLIHCAKVNKADAVKIQTYTADTMTIKSKKKNFKIQKGIWKNYYLWDLYKEAHTPYEWHEELFNYSKKIGIEIFSTPFDETAVELLENLKCPRYKIASFEMTDLPLIKRVAQTKKPIIISTGMASLKEINEAYNTAKKYGDNDITLLYCVSNYPSKSDDFNMNNIKILKDKFKCKIGFSDHSNDNRIALAAIAAGAEMVEKHIALKNQKKGHDIKFSLKGNKIKQFKDDIVFVSKLFQQNNFLRNKSENMSKIFRRSIFAVKDIVKGEKFTSENIRRIRPNRGIEPKYYSKLLGKLSPQNLKKEKPINKQILKKMKIKYEKV